VLASLFVGTMTGVAFRRRRADRSDPAGHAMAGGLRCWVAVSPPSCSFALPRAGWA